MRSPVLRTCGLVLVSVAAILFTGCGSNNTGKIVGKWKMTSAPGGGKDLAEMKAAGMAVAWDFKADGTFSIGIVADDNKPESQLAAKLADAEMQKKNMGGKYTLGMGNQVNLSGISGVSGAKSGLVTVTIDGDKMTLKDGDGTSQFVRIQ